MADIFTTVGEGLVADYLDGTTGAPTNWYTGSGTDATAAAKGDSTLGAEVESRVVCTESQPSANINRLVSLITYTATRAIVEMGIFDASTAGNMLVSSSFAAINVDSGDKIEFTTDITHS